MNPSIIQPNWLAKNKIFLEHGDDAQVKMPFGTNQPTEFKAGKFRWSIDYSMLKVNIEPNEELSLLQGFIEAVFKELRHTPVTATGQNFVFEEDSRLTPLNFLSKEDWAVNKETEWGVLKQLSREAVISVDDKKSINIALKEGPEKTRIGFNFHCDATNSEEVRDFAKTISENFDLSKKILQEINA